MACDIDAFGALVLAVQARVIPLPPVHQLHVLGHGVHVEEHLSALLAVEGLHLEVNFVDVVVHRLQLVGGEQAALIVTLVV